MIWRHSENDNSIISSENYVTRCTGHETISYSDGLFRHSASVKSWIRSAIHCIQLLDYSRNTMGVRELRSICEELELNGVFFCEYYFHIFSHVSFKGNINISPGHHVADTEFQILVRISSNFVAVFMLCSSVVHLKSIKIIISSLLVFNF